MFALSRLTARRCSTFLFPMFSLNPSVLSCFFGKTGSPSRYLRDDIKDPLPKLPWDLLGPDVNRAYLRKRLVLITWSNKQRLATTFPGQNLLILSYVKMRLILSYGQIDHPPPQSTLLNLGQPWSLARIIFESPMKFEAHDPISPESNASSWARYLREINLIRYRHLVIR